ncbi:Maltooligosyl trehalose synthase [Planktothrix tepida]|uniref:Maltooligosyltrehalose synthase n=1 Tax=Planktothrix tepida PCC 9214 TaxID=671072 RepID=A0A1J1LKY3_9CYAN|nr:malto-oligosyltrehalose synthase [Planktothrix tepida]CAD5940047.1 Maltooligosyl trehalose synthase [Planktothrix tepida]CUR33176.1 Maltooligosyltrehalose synthase [Planktothrix tepida PCC 9214]
MRIPLATYRIQFNPDFNFNQTKEIIAYLQELGISDLYASPIFKARSGSTHGYDVVDPNQLNPELGTQEDFDQLMEEVKNNGMGWLQDIVPNHMAYDSQNQYLTDIFEFGSDSDYLEFFDIDWKHPYSDFQGRVLAPLLGDFYGNCLENGQLKISYGEAGLSVNYYSLKFPLKIESYTYLITPRLKELEDRLGRRHPNVIKLLGVLYVLKNIPHEESSQDRRSQAVFAKGLLWELYQENSDIQKFIDENIEYLNGKTGDTESFNFLDQLLSEQFFRLSYWKVGAEELNYRRFFTVNELISVKVEDEKVFNKTHDLILKFVRSGKFTGLRIDHIDGLYNPLQYLQGIREKVGNVYLTVEKILDVEEELPSNWPIEGTSGYEFLIYLNSLFCQRQNEDRFSQIYRDVTGLSASFKQLLIDKKRLIADRNLAGDADNLAGLLKRIAGQYRYGRDFTLQGLQTAILEVLVRFPVYRTYINEGQVSEEDRYYVQFAIQEAKGQHPELINELNLIEKFLLLEYDDYLSDENKQLWLHFVSKFQQFSGPLTAKGVEDTLFYVYNRFVSLNEVGGAPHQFGISSDMFHQFNKKRAKSWPHTMNTTSTHDTKRSEDLRARLNVISEIPDEWEAQVRTWIALNRDKKIETEGRIIPDGNDEYFLYQNLIGSYPFYETEYPEFVERVKQFAIKAVREAKVHTAWLRPDSVYEEGFFTFVDKILNPSEDNQFLQEFRNFQQKIAFYGMFNSLSQTLIKITSPGLPDFYQGTELWDLSLVDPDNRRPVNYQKRMQFLEEIKRRSQEDTLSLIEELKASPEDGRMKLFLIYQGLIVRKQYLEVYQQGTYIPLEITGDYAEHILAFARTYGQQIIITVVPQFLTNLVEPQQFPLGENIWKDTAIEIPEDWETDWKNTLTNQLIKGGHSLKIGDILTVFPVALLTSC